MSNEGDGDSINGVSKKRMLMTAKEYMDVRIFYQIFWQICITNFTIFIHLHFSIDTF